MIKALEQIRRMRGGAQLHLVRCRDAGAEAMPLEGLAVWTAKMRPMIE